MSARREIRDQASRQLHLLLVVCVGAMLASIVAVAWNSHAAAERRAEIADLRELARATSETRNVIDVDLGRRLGELVDVAAGSSSSRAVTERALAAPRAAVAELLGGSEGGAPRSTENAAIVNLCDALDDLEHGVRAAVASRAEHDATSQARADVEARCATLLARADVVRERTLERLAAATVESELALARLEGWLYAILGFALSGTALVAARTSKAVRGLVDRLHESHRGQQQMIDRLATLQAAVESADAGMIVCDPDGTARWSNPAIGRLTGRRPDEIAGRGTGEILVALDGEQADARASDGRADVRVLRADGTERVAEQSVTAVLDERGVPVHRVVFLTDVTESRAQSERLRRALIENRMILDSITSILIVVDGHLRVRTWNEHAEQVIGVSAESVAGRRIDELGFDFVAAVMREPIEQSLRDETARRVEDVTFRRSETDVRHLAFTIAPILSREGVLHGCLLVGRDLTEMRRMQAQLTQAQKLESIGQLAAGIAHEINTPTQFVQDNTRFVQSSFQELEELLGLCRAIGAETGCATDSASTETLREIVRRTDLDFLVAEIPKALEDNLAGLGRVAGIVGAMKQFSHMGTGLKELVDLNAAIQNTCTVARNEWKYVADLAFDLQPDLPLVPCLPAEIAQVFLNVVVNAAHALEPRDGRSSAEKGRIGISTRARDGWVEVRISDTGCGIPESIRRRIYDPFFTTKGVGKGTGQGLAIARNIVVDRHGGTIGCESEVGKGTTFVVRLPLAEAAPSVPVEDDGSRAAAAELAR